MIELTMESPVTILIMLCTLLFIVLALGVVFVLKDMLGICSNICADDHEEIQREYRERARDES